MNIKEECELCHKKTFRWRVKRRSIKTPIGNAMIKKRVCNECGLAIKTLEKIINAPK